MKTNLLDDICHDFNNNHIRSQIIFDQILNSPQKDYYYHDLEQSIVHMQVAARAIKKYFMEMEKQKKRVTHKDELSSTAL